LADEEFAECRDEEDENDEAEANTKVMNMVKLDYKH